MTAWFVSILLALGALYPGMLVAENNRDDHQTSDPAELPAVQPWPAEGTVESLMMSGIFYGMTHGGLQTGNTTLAIEHSFRFRAEKSAAITALRWQNRLLTQGNVDSRTNKGYAECRRSQLHPNVCAYLLGNPYHVGNGGKIVASIHPDDGRGLPDESRLLGQVVEPYIASRHPHAAWVSQPLKAPVPVVAGALYHVVLNNLAPPRLPLHRNSVQQAQAKDPDTGAISLNGIWHGELVGPESLKWGPYYGRLGQAALYRNQAGGRWNENPHTFGWLEFQYDYDQWSGESNAGYDNIRYDTDLVSFRAQEGYKVIGGPVRARQSFRVQDAGRIINGVWLNFSMAPSANLSPLTVELKNVQGQVLATGTIAASPRARERTLAGLPVKDLAAINARTWGYTELTETRLQFGRRYSLEISAPADAGFHLRSYYPHTSDNRNSWHEALAEVDKGNGWEPFAGPNGRPERDLPVMFTIKGMPKRLP